MSDHQHLHAAFGTSNTAGYPKQSESQQRSGNTLTSFFNETMAFTKNSLGLPHVNPNAVSNNKIVEDFPTRSTWEYQPGNRSFIYIKPEYEPNITLNTADTDTQPINVRLLESYKQALVDTEIRRQQGVNYTP